MSAEINKQIELEIAHVLFIDIVGYSKLSINEQRAAVEELNQIVRATEQFQKGEATEQANAASQITSATDNMRTQAEQAARATAEQARTMKEMSRARFCQSADRCSMSFR